MACGSRGVPVKRCLAVALLATAAVARMSAQAATPPDPERYSFHERPGVELPTQPVFLDSDGRTVRLSALPQGLPLIVVLAYFHCSSLCGLVRSSLFAALGAAKLSAGRDYALAVVSIDPHETSADAARREGYRSCRIRALRGRELRALPHRSGERYSSARRCRGISRSL